MLLLIGLDVNNNFYGVNDDNVFFVDILIYSNFVPQETV